MNTPTERLRLALTDPRAKLSGHGNGRRISVRAADLKELLDRLDKPTFKSQSAGPDT